MNALGYVARALTDSSTCAKPPERTLQSEPGIMSGKNSKMSSKLLRLASVSSKLARHQPRNMRKSNKQLLLASAKTQSG